MPIAPFIAQIGNKALDVGSSIGLGLVDNWLYRQRNAHLTGKEVEAFNKNAEQAQAQRDWEEEMSNTAYQRAVADMIKAGLNPALMYGNGSAASTPTGSNAQGSASVNSASLGEMISQMTQLRMANADIKLKESEANLNNTNAVKADIETDLLRSNIQGSKLDNDAKMIVNRYLEEQEQLKIANAKEDVETKKATQREIGERINKMSVEQTRIFVDMLEAMEKIEVLKSQKSLNDAQAYECYHMVKQIDANARYLNIQADNYDLTQGVTVKLEVAFGPFKVGETRYLTLPQLREYVKKREEAMSNRDKPKGERKENNAGLDYQDFRVD